MKTQYKILGMLLICFLFGSILGYTLAQSGNTFIITSGIYPMGDFTIWQEGSNTYSKTKYGEIAYSGTNATTVIQNTLDLANDPNIIKFIGNINLPTIPIRIHNGTTLDLRGASLTYIGASAGNLAIIENYRLPIGSPWTEAWNRDIRIIGGKLEGNNNAQFGIYFRQVRNGFIEGVTVYGIQNIADWGIGILWNWAEDGAYIQNNVITEMTYNASASGDIAGIWVSGINHTDSLIKGNSIIQSDTRGFSRGIVVEDLAENVTVTENTIRGGNIALLGTAGGFLYDVSVENNRVTGSGASIGNYGIEINYVNNSRILNNKVKNFGYSGIRIVNSYNNTVSLNDVSENGVGAVTPYGIYLGNSNFTMVIGGYYYDFQVSPTQIWGIYEDSDSNFNVFIGLNAIGSAGGIRLIGANSTANLCWNSSIWLP